MTALLNQKKRCQSAAALAVPREQRRGAVSARRASGQVPPSRQGSLFLSQKVPREEMRLLPRCPPRSSPSFPSQWCFPLPPPLRAGLGFAGFFVCFALAWAVSVLQGAAGHPSGLVPHGVDPRWRHLAQPLRFGSVGGTWQMLLAAGMILEPAQKLLPSLSMPPRAACSCPPSPPRYSHKQELE